MVIKLIVNMGESNGNCTGKKSGRDIYTYIYRFNKMSTISKITQQVKFSIYIAAPVSRSSQPNLLPPTQFDPYLYHKNYMSYGSVNKHYAIKNDASSWKLS